MTVLPLAPPASPRIAGPPQRAEGHADVLMEKAHALEAAFLAEMLGHAGLGETDGAFTGGAGEAQFASFLREEQARALVARGGIGLAESLFRALSGGTDGQG